MEKGEELCTSALASSLPGALVCSPVGAEKRRRLIVAAHSSDRAVGTPERFLSHDAGNRVPVRRELGRPGVKSQPLSLIHI